jgi:hypothetical protein
MNQRDSQWRFSLAHLLAVIAYIAFTLSIVKYTGSLTSGVHLFLCLTGWLMWRFAHVRLAGLLPALVGADIVLSSSVSFAFVQGNDFAGAAGVSCGSVVVLIGLAVLAAISVRKGQYWQCQIGTAAVGLLLLVAWWFSLPVLTHAARASDIAENSVATAQAVSMIEDVRQQLGRVPTESELSDLLAQPLPSIRWGRFSARIDYRRIGGQAYELSYVDPSEMGDFVIYRSDTAEKGWYRAPF